MSELLEEVHLLERKAAALKAILESEQMLRLVKQPVIQYPNYPTYPNIPSWPIQPWTYSGASCHINNHTLTVDQLPKHNG